MSDFEVSLLIQNNVQSLYLMRDSIWIDPPYQRVSDIWTPDKRQLLIDSILNGFDIPKLYFHALAPPRKQGKLVQKYAIIDGKQRLDAVWAFIDGKFTLADDFEYLHDSKIKAGGLSYGDLNDKYPHLRARFDATQLSVVVVRTDDIELIEDMFSRLNEAVPLNAPEKRNAFGGAMPPAIRKLAGHSFFTDKLPFEDRRYKHRDLATKLLLIEQQDSVVDTKKVYLDSFVRKWAEERRTEAEANQLSSRVAKHLDRMSGLFVDDDPLLASIGMTIVLFHFFRLADKLKCVPKIRREHFQLFNDARAENRIRAEKDLSSASYDLLEFEKYVQSPNDAYATRLRLSIMVDFIRSQGVRELPRTHEYFDPVH
jgi:hypothetical protein